MTTRANPEIRVLWIVPERTGGIRTYAEGLLNVLRTTKSAAVDAIWELPDRGLLPPSEGGRKFAHLHHEFGFFGSKLPGRYAFPRWIRAIKAKNPETTWIATAHNVIGQDYVFPLEGKPWWSILPRVLANAFLISWLRKAWTTGTWGEFDGVVVHSNLQVDAVRKSGCDRVAVIPLFVPRAPMRPDGESGTNVTVFGYFSPDKGQDIVIRAWALLGSNAPKLVLAGGVRRPEDERYLKECRTLIRTHGLGEKIQITGYVPDDKLDSLYRDARLVLAPFRVTTGSASITAAFARGVPVLASDHPLNCELAERVPDCVAFFRSESPESLAAEIRSLFADSNRLRHLAERAKKYAEMHTPEKMAALHLDFYKTFENPR